MTMRIADWLHRYRLIPWLVIALFLPVGLWPASWWFEVKEINFSNTRQGEAIVMAVDRKVNRGFKGQWSVTVRQWDGAGWLTYCNASGASNYRTESRFPVPLTLKWWTDGQCHELPVGRYKVTTSWEIDAAVLGKSITIDSNIFEVRP